MSIWNLPESARLEAQTLDKLASAPWRLLHGSTEVSNAPVALLRPLLDDIVQEESYMEIGFSTNGPGEWAFAIRLGDRRAGLWKTNLAAVLESLAGVRSQAKADASGWSLTKHDAPDLIELARVGEWVVVGAAQKHNARLNEIKERIKGHGVPFGESGSNDWLVAEVDLRRAADALSLKWDLPEGFPRILATITGDGENVRTRGELKFAKPLNIQFEPWNIPTNLVGEPLTGFTAVRGIKPWLASLKAWNDLEIGPPPNQAFVWTMPGIPAQTFFAAPQAEASNQVHRIAGRLMEKANPILETNGWGVIGKSAEVNVLEWTGMPFVWPFLRIVPTNGGDFLYAGSFNPPTVANPPAGLLQAVFGQINLVWYDWEITGASVEPWLYLTQLLRMVSNRAQLPQDSEPV